MFPKFLLIYIQNDTELYENEMPKKIWRRGKYLRKNFILFNLVLTNLLCVEKYE